MEAIMSDNIPTPDWSKDPLAQEPNFGNSDSPTIQGFDSSFVPPSAPPPPPPNIDYGLPPAQPAKKNNIWIWVVVILLVLFLCCCCLGIVGLVAASSNSGGSYNIFDNTSFIVPLII
jgi:hypothetical protein